MSSLERFKHFVNLLKDKIHSVDEIEWHKLLLENYQQFALMDINSNWINGSIAAYDDVLIPREQKKEKIIAFIDETEKALLENEYFVKLLESIPWEQADQYSPLTILPQAKNSEQDVLKYMVSFAFCLEKINALVREDFVVLEMLIHLYKINRKKNNFYRFSNILGIIKFHSIELPLVRFLKAKKAGKLPKNFGKFILSFNIFEATLVDLVVGFIDNARSTFPLIFFSPNYKGMYFLRKYKRGEASSFSKDGKALLMFSPAPKEWADLYQVWNMAFVSQFPQSPYLLIKLIIPSVSSYLNRPAEYMHTRITALHLAMNYLDSAMNAPKIKIDLNQIGPSEKSLTKLWGKINKSCAEDYIKTITKSSE